MSHGSSSDERILRRRLLWQSLWFSRRSFSTSRTTNDRYVGRLIEAVERVLNRLFSSPCLKKVRSPSTHASYCTITFFKRYRHGNVPSLFPRKTWFHVAAMWLLNGDTRHPNSRKNLNLRGGLTKVADLTDRQNLGCLHVYEVFGGSQGSECLLQLQKAQRK